MKVAAYTSDVTKLSIMSTEYERHKEDGYPIALFDTEKNNAIYGRNQFLIGELLRLADKLFHQPITSKGETLFFFQVAMLNQENIYQNAIVNHATALIPKVLALNHEKFNPRIAGEIDNRVQLILKHSLSMAIPSNKDFELLVADVLGVSLISITCIKEFFSLRLNSRNYILKALRYIIFDNSINDAVYPELNVLKKKYCFSLQSLSKLVANELLVFYKLGTYDCKQQNLIKAVSNICKTYTNSYSLDIPLLLGKLNLGNALLEKMNHICESDFLLGQILIYALNQLKKTDGIGYLKKLHEVIEGGAAEYNILSLALQFDNKDHSAFPSEPKFHLLKKTTPNYLEIMKLAYILHLNNGLSRSTTFFRFLDSYLTSGYYVHSKNASLILSRLLEGVIGLAFISKVNTIENIFAKKESEVFSGAKYDFLCQLLFLTISCDVNPIDGFSAILNHELLSKKIPNQDSTYEVAIKDYSTLNSYVQLFDLHNPLLAKIESLNRFNPHQFELHNVFDFTTADIPVKLLKSPEDFKEALKTTPFLSACDIGFLRLIEHSNLVVIRFGVGFESYAVINVSKLNFVSNYGYGLMKVIGVETTEEQYIDAMKITQFMNQNTISTLE